MMVVGAVKHYNYQNLNVVRKNYLAIVTCLVYKRAASRCSRQQRRDASLKDALTLVYINQRQRQQRLHDIVKTGLAAPSSVHV